MTKMVSFCERLSELKESLKPVLESRMIFLLNPKDTKVLEAVVAWTAVPAKDLSGILVAENATMDDLWREAEPDIFSFATALGCTFKDAIPRFNQLKGLSLIYPDGTAYELALSVINTYMAIQIGELRNKRSKSEQSH